VAIPTCESCGARIEPSHLACPYCRAITPFGLARRAQDEHARWAQEAAAVVAAQRSDAQSRALAQTELDRIGRLSVIWSVVGFVFCCLPVPSIVSLVLAVRARLVAREKGFVVPAQATIGLLLSLVTMLLSGSFYTFAGVSAIQKQRRIQALESKTAVTAAAQTLDHDTACALVEIYLLSHGFSSSSDDIDNLTCDGALEQHGSNATVHDVTFEVSTSFHTTDASMKRGERWIVERVADATASPAAPAVAKGGAPPVHASPAPSAAGRHGAGATAPAKAH
jgi:hypothetical protein